MIKKLGFAKLGFALFFCNALAFAQTRLSFEVVSIKPAAPMTAGTFRMGTQQDPGRITFTNQSLNRIVAQAYKLKPYQVTGPEWINATRFDITAKFPEGATKEDVPAMLQSMLEDRFQLKFHREPKELPIYGLVVGKNGIKMPVAEESKESGPEGARRMVRFTPGHLELQRVTLAGLADTLSSFVDRPIFDETKTPGLFQCKLEFALDTAMMGTNSGRVGGGAGSGSQVVVIQRSGAGEDGGGGERPSVDPSLPSIFTAVQDQLGLRLEAKKAPVEILVIDKIEKTPTEN